MTRRAAASRRRAMETDRSEHEATEGRKAHEATEQRKQEEAREHNAAVREWARQHGHAISARGRLPRSVLEAYRNEVG